MPFQTRTIAVATCQRLGNKPDTDFGVVAGQLQDVGVDLAFIPWNEQRQWGDFAACIVKATWDYIDEPEQFIRWVNQTNGQTKVFNDSDSICWNVHKAYLLELNSSGVPTVPTIIVPRDTPHETRPWAEPPWEEIVVKPAISVGGLRTQRFAEDLHEARRFIDTLLATGDVLIQPFVPSILTEGETSIVYIDGALSHAVSKRVPVGGFAAQRSLGARIEVCSPHPREVELAAKALRLVPPTLFARVDIVWFEGCPVVMEVELIEPALFLDLVPEAAGRLVAAIAARV